MKMTNSLYQSEVDINYVYDGDKWTIGKIWANTSDEQLHGIKTY